MSPSTHLEVSIRTPKEVQRNAYNRVPETCETVQAILEQALNEIKAAYDIQNKDETALSMSLDMAFIEIRNNVTHVFRDEQITLLHKLYATEAYE